MARSRRSFTGPAGHQATQPYPKGRKPRLGPVAAQQSASNEDHDPRWLSTPAIAKLCDLLLEPGVPVTPGMIADLAEWCSKTDPDASKGYAAAMCSIVRLGVDSVGWSLFEYAKSVDVEVWHRAQRRS